MRYLKILFSLCILSAFLIGCSPVDKSAEEAPKVVSAAVPEETEPAGKPLPPPAAPGKEEVLAAREKALEGMSQEQIERLNEVIIAANLKLESGYLNDNIFEKLEDPDSLVWNYFDQTGEIQIAWAYDGNLDMDAVCKQEGLTEEEFYNKYGTKVSTTNTCTADDFISLMNELETGVQNETLKADLQYMADEMESAKGHVVEHVNNVYKKLHDLDYFLLRYGPEVFDSYASNYDKSTVSRYYGTLSIYNTL